MLAKKGTLFVAVNRTWIGGTLLGRDFFEAVLDLARGFSSMRIQKRTRLLKPFNGENIACNFHLNVSE